MPFGFVLLEFSIEFSSFRAVAYIAAPFVFLEGFEVGRKRLFRRVVEDRKAYRSHIPIYLAS